MRKNKFDNNQEMLNNAPYSALLFRLCLPSVIVMIVYNMIKATKGYGGGLRNSGYLRQEQNRVITLTVLCSRAAIRGGLPAKPPSVSAITM